MTELLEQAPARRAESATWIDLPRALRCPHWIKNLVLLVPAAFSAEGPELLARPALWMGVAAFCAVASAGYVINDLLNQDYDRQTSWNCDRPLVANRIAKSSALALFLLSGAIGVSAAFSLSLQVGLCALIYFWMSCFYSRYVWKMPLFDAIVIGSMYGVRLIAGFDLASIPYAEIGVGLCVATATSLVLVKRIGEKQATVSLPRTMRVYGDVHTGAIVGASVMLSVVTFVGLEYYFLQSNPLAWRLMPLLLLLWQLRMVVGALKGRFSGDPMSFVLRDGCTRAMVLVAVTLWALGVWSV